MDSEGECVLGHGRIVFPRAEQDGEDQAQGRFRLEQVESAWKEQKISIISKLLFLLLFLPRCVAVASDFGKILGILGINFVASRRVGFGVKAVASLRVERQSRRVRNFTRRRVLQTPRVYPWKKPGRVRLISRTNRIG